MHKRLLTALTMNLTAVARAPSLTCYDVDGNVITQDELKAWFTAPVPIERAQAHREAPYVARVTSLHCRKSACVQMVRVVDPSGQPLPGAAVARWWNDAPVLDAYPADCHATRWRERAVVGYTDATGTVGFGMGGGDQPPGWSGVWVLHCDAPGDWVGGLGWVTGTGYHTVEPTFTICPAGDGPSPQPTDADLAGLLTDLEEIGALSIATHAFARGAIALVKSILNGGK
jgi:hypothetical protein